MFTGRINAVARLALPALFMRLRGVFIDIATGLGLRRAATEAAQ